MRCDATTTAGGPGASIATGCSTASRPTAWSGRGRSPAARTERCGSPIAPPTRSAGSRKTARSVSSAAPVSTIPVGITAKFPDGAVWFTNYGDNTVGRITEDGDLSFFRGKGINLPIGIALGPDKAVWFTNRGSNAIGRLTPDGRLRIFKRAAISWPRDIVPGADGALWFTNLNKRPVGRITTAGRVTTFRVDGVKRGFALTAGAGKTLWLADHEGGTVASITTAGVASVRKVDKAPLGIASTDDGAVWLADDDADAIDRLAGGSLSSYGAPVIDGLGRLAAGPDEAIWFTSRPDQIARMTTDGIVTDFTDPDLHGPGESSPAPTGRSGSSATATRSDG